MTIIRESFLDVGGVATRSLAVDGAQPPIILLHGFTDSADTWRPVLTELAARGRAAVALDLPGGGYADPLGRPAVAGLDRFVDAAISDFAADGAVLVGNSLGGLAALRAATRSDLPVDAVVGLGPAGLTYGWRLEVLIRVLPILAPPLRLFDGLPVPASVLRRCAAWLYASRLAANRADPDLARRYAGHVDGLADVARLREDLLALGRESQTDLLDVAAIDVPVLLIWGAKDPLADPRGAPDFLAAVPDSRLELFADCGHCPQLEHPAAVARLIASLSPTP